MSPWRQAVLIVLAFAGLRFWYTGRTQLAEDEAYYWEWSRTPALSYYDQGPMLAVAIKAGTSLLGQDERGVRLAAVACGAASALLVAGAGTLVLGSAVAAPWLALACHALLLYAVGGVLMMHDTLMGFFWVLALYAALRALANPRWWLLAGAAVALGGLSKYTMVLLPACLIGALVSRPSLRPALLSPWLWVGAAVAALGALPILLWNAANGWPSFQHVGSLAGADPSRRAYGAWAEYLGSQAGLVTPLLLWLVLTGWRDAWRERSRSSDARWLVLWASAPVALFFLALSLRTRVEGNWAAPAYLGGLLLAADRLHKHGQLNGRFSRWALGMGLAFSALVYAQALHPFLPLPQRWARADAPARLDGWRELAQRVEAERQKLGPAAMVCARTYQNAAELGFYLAGQPRVLIVQDGQLNHQYRFWNHPELFKGRDAILVAGQDWELGEMAPRFARWEPLPDEPFVRNGNEIRRTRLMRAYGFKG